MPRALLPWSPLAWLAILACVATGLAAAPKTVGGDAPPPRKVWTASDLEKLPESSVSIVGSTDAAPRPAEPETPAPAAAPAVTTDEATWRAQARALDETIALQESRLTRIEARLESWRLFALGTTGYEAHAADAITDLMRQQAAAEAALRQARGERVLLEERARQTGVLPGWLR